MLSSTGAWLFLLLSAADNGREALTGGADAVARIEVGEGFEREVEAELLAKAVVSCVEVEAMQVLGHAQLLRVAPLREAIIRSKRFDAGLARDSA